MRVLIVAAIVGLASAAPAAAAQLVDQPDSTEAANRALAAVVCDFSIEPSEGGFIEVPGGVAYVPPGGAIVVLPIDCGPIPPALIP